MSYGPGLGRVVRLELSPSLLKASGIAPELGDLTFCREAPVQL